MGKKRKNSNKASKKSKKQKIEHPIKHELKKFSEKGWKLLIKGKLSNINTENNTIVNVSDFVRDDLLKLFSFLIPKSFWSKLKRIANKNLNRNVSIEKSYYEKRINSEIDVIKFFAVIVIILFFNLFIDFFRF